MGRIRLVVITGGPGTGKTATLQELSAMGFRTVPEAARAVIEQEQGKPGGRLPWTDRDAYQRLVLKRQLKSLKGLSGTVFLDRAPHDALAYYRVQGLRPPPDLLESMSGIAYSAVFLLDRLRGYRKDRQRKEDAKAAAEIHKALARVYEELGYRPVRVPVMDPRKRAILIAEKAGLRPPLPPI